MNYGEIVTKSKAPRWFSRVAIVANTLLLWMPYLSQTSHITAHPDAIWKAGGIPTAIIEIKTTNSAGVSRKPYESHIRRLMAYLAITNLPFAD